MRKLEVLGAILRSGLVAVVRAGSPAEAEHIADACGEGGISAIEITFTVPGAVHVIEHLGRKKGALVGAGTVLDPETARTAILAGAQFVVSPSLNADTARLCNRYQVPYMPGAGTI